MRLLMIVTLFLITGINAKAQQVQKQDGNSDGRKGVASFYHERFEGRRTATGDVFDNDKYTAACNKLKLGTYVKVTNLNNGKVVYVKINDRMAANNPRIIDLASVAAEDLDFISRGTAKVKVEIVPEEEGAKRILAQREDDIVFPMNKL